MEFWCELESPYTYLAAMRIEAIAGIAVRWRPFSLGPIFRKVGWQTSPFELYADKGRYMWRDVEREAERLGIPFRRPSAFPRNAVAAAKIAIAGMSAGWGVAFAKRVMQVEFVDDRDIGERDVLQGLVSELGVTSVADDGGALRRATEEAAALGIFGSPTFMVGDEMFWGNDRLERALEWAA